MKLLAKRYGNRVALTKREALASAKLAKTPANSAEPVLSLTKGFVSPAPPKDVIDFFLQEAL